MRPGGITIDTVVVPPVPLCNDNPGSSGKHNRCSCGNLIVHVKNDDDCQPRSPRHQAVFNRLYRHRLTKELHHRKLAAEQINKEARECTYIPLTNNVRRQVQSASSLTSIAHREQRIEQAREQFNQGNMCVECLKEVEMSTGTFMLGEEPLANDRLMTQSLPNIHTKSGHDLPPSQIVFLNSNPPAETRDDDIKESLPTPPVSRFPTQQATIDERRNDESGVDKPSPSAAEADREASTSLHPPSEIILSGITVGDKDETKSKTQLNRFGFPAPSPTIRKKPVEKNQTDEMAAFKVEFPPRVPKPPRKAFSFDAVSQVSSDGLASSESELTEASKQDVISSAASILKNNALVEEKEPIVAESESHESSISPPLRHDSYISIGIVPDTPHSVPYDERGDIEEQSEDSEDTASVVQETMEQLAWQNQPVQEQKEQADSPATSPASQKSDAMRLISILDREDSFNGPVFVQVAPTEEDEINQVSKNEDWIRQVTDFVTCDEAPELTGTDDLNNSVLIDEIVESYAADQAYVGCEMEGAELDCTDLAGEHEISVEITTSDAIPSSTERKDASAEEDKQKNEGKVNASVQEEDWLKQATEWAAYDRAPSSPRPTPGQAEAATCGSGFENQDNKSNKEESKTRDQIVLAPTDEGFFNTSRNNSGSKSTGDKSSDSEPFFGASRRNSERSGECSTVALTEDSHNDDRGIDDNKKSQGELDDFLNKLTACVTCWKLEPWPDHPQE